MKACKIAEPREWQWMIGFAPALIVVLSRARFVYFESYAGFALISLLALEYLLRVRRTISLASGAFRALGARVLMIMRPDATWFATGEPGQLGFDSKERAFEVDMGKMSAGDSRFFSAQFLSGPSLVLKGLIVAIAISPCTAVALPFMHLPEVVATAIEQLWLIRALVYVACAYWLVRCYQNLTISFDGISLGNKLIRWDEVRRADTSGSSLNLSCLSHGSIRARLVSVGPIQHGSTLAAEIINGGRASLWSRAYGLPTRGNLETRVVERPRSLRWLVGWFVSLRLIDVLGVYALASNTSMAFGFGVAWLSLLCSWPLFVFLAKPERLDLTDADESKLSALDGDLCIVRAEKKGVSAIVTGLQEGSIPKASLQNIEIRLRADRGMLSSTLKSVGAIIWVVAIGLASTPLWRLALIVLLPLALFSQLIWLMTQRDLEISPAGIALGSKRIGWSTVMDARADGARLVVESRGGTLIRASIQSSKLSPRTAIALASVIREHEELTREDRRPDEPENA